ncbi:ABC transporter substrate-binding protein [Chelativorans sp. AA-79]|uniref:ABC transporter substrate-binding protein n=1 Tax=Chelativorans sp. AA-79 TaxID=3028735 RepID=UPI0023F66A07|nr:ABC transporter substrate-binding protein [Chelativorans sp. AA-79]WEX09031.1 ABC transporter substrate-binding protein [Chelativorans sp. AA-79]
MTFSLSRRQAFSALFAFAAFSLAPAAVAAQEKSLAVGMASVFTTLDPHEDSNSPNNAASRHIFDSLINRGPNAENLPQLATEWRAIDDTHWEFKLREDVKFHDGTDFDAEDVIASLLRARDKPTQSFAAYTRNIADVTTPDPHTVVVETTVPDPLILNSLSRIRIISADHAEDDVAAFDSGAAAVGTGPFKFVSYTPGDRLVLARNDDYFAGPAAWSEVTLRMIPDAGARLASLLSGELDVIEKLPAEGRERVESSDSLQVIRGQSTRIVYLGMDLSRDNSPFISGKDGAPLDGNPLKDARVRKAILMSINRPAIVERIMQGSGTVAHQFVAEDYFGHSENVEKVEYDPEGARKLLEEAGYPDGFRMTIHGPSGRYTNDSDVLQAVGQMLSRIGIETAVEVMPWSMYSGRYSEGEFSLFLGSWGVNTGEVSNPAIALVAAREEEKGTGRYNGGGIDDPEINSLLDKASATLDEGTREELLRKVSELTFNQTLLIPMHYESVVLGASKEIQMKPRGDQYTLVYEIKPAD